MEPKPVRRSSRRSGDRLAVASHARPFGPGRYLDNLGTCQTLPTPSNSGTCPDNLEDWHRWIAALILFTLALVSCTSPDPATMAIVSHHQEPRCKTDPAMGSMDEAPLIEWAKYCWGGVVTINTTETKAGRRDQVVVTHGYGGLGKGGIRLYYYFENGKMTGVQRQPTSY